MTGRIKGEDSPKQACSCLVPSPQLTCYKWRELVSSARFLFCFLFGFGFSQICCVLVLLTLNVFVFVFVWFSSSFSLSLKLLTAFSFNRFFDMHARPGGSHTQLAANKCRCPLNVFVFVFVWFSSSFSLSLKPLTAFSFNRFFDMHARPGGSHTQLAANKCRCPLFVLFIYFRVFCGRCRFFPESFCTIIAVFPPCIESTLYVLSFQMVFFHTL